MRFYTNPFVKDAPMVVAVACGEWRFSGYSITPDGVTADYVRDMTYSDGTTRSESDPRPSDLRLDRSTGEVYQQHEPRQPGAWGVRVYFPSLVPLSKSPSVRTLRDIMQR